MQEGGVSLRLSRCNHLPHKVLLENNPAIWALNPAFLPGIAALTVRVSCRLRLFFVFLVFFVANPLALLRSNTFLTTRSYRPNQISVM